jgi:membrane protein
VFSLGPVFVIIISLAGIFFGKDAIRGKLYYQLNGLIGSEAALQIQEIIQNIEKSQLSTSGAVIGIIVLVIGATGVFSEIQDSINYIWSLKSKPRQGWLQLIFNRLISFSLIVSLAFLLLVSLGIHAVVDLLHDKLKVYFNEATVYIFEGINYIVLFALISTLFAIIFKVLPDGVLKWKDAFVGAMFTALLFLIGKFFIGFYLGNSSIGVTYGAAAAIIIILLWVYYTSIILYFGAEFTKVYTLNFGSGIIPDKTAVFIVKQEVKELNINREEFKTTA